MQRLDSSSGHLKPIIRTNDLISKEHPLGNANRRGNSV